MKKIKRKRWIAVAAAVLAAALMSAAAAPSAGNVCMKALESCLGDALFSSLISFNIGVLGVYGASCFLGYQWCLRYYEN